MYIVYIQDDFRSFILRERKKNNKQNKTKTPSQSQKENIAIKERLLWNTIFF